DRRAVLDDTELDRYLPVVEPDVLPLVTGHHVMPGRNRRATHRHDVVFTAGDLHFQHPAHTGRNHQPLPSAFEEPGIRGHDAGGGSIRCDGRIHNELVALGLAVDFEVPAVLVGHTL